jgi:hypothetical protein
MVAFLESDIGNTAEASAAPPGADRLTYLALRSAQTVVRHLMATLYLFGRPTGSCMAPVIAADGS